MGCVIFTVTNHVLWEGGQHGGCVVVFYCD